MASSYDVIVVGGGPAGGTAAYELAREGARTLVLERERLPRYKACAGGLPLKTLRLLGLDLSSTCETEITKGKCTFRGDYPVEMDFGKVVGWTVMRDKFDHLILRAAATAGARVLDCQTVTEVRTRSDRAIVRTSGEEFSCSIVIGADGANSVIARSAGLMKKRRLAVALESEIRAPEEIIDEWRGCVQFDLGSAPRGYGWIFPKREFLSVGVATVLARPQDLKAHLLRLLEQVGIRQSSDEIKMRGHLVPLGGVDRVLHRERVLVAGDAAGVAEPMTGEGIYYAIRSAKLAARVISRALEEGSVDLSPYTAQVNAQITRDLKYARLLAHMLYRLPRLTYHFFVRSPVVQWGIADVLYGTSTFQRLFFELLKKGPTILAAGLR
ncbi:MAG: geranylgeranyl reductase family protein [Anaerolineae bacterium]|nr:geranylgeranyl reductase family protein [Anaerolineae bacterium]